MILTFSQQQFVDKIKEGIQIHTIRQDLHNRWKKGRSIHFWSGNPRSGKTKIVYPFAEGVCSRVENISIFPNENKIEFCNVTYTRLFYLNTIAIHDGFSGWEEMKTFFKEEFHGKLIYWDVSTLRFLD